MTVSSVIVQDRIEAASVRQPSPPERWPLEIAAKRRKRWSAGISVIYGFSQVVIANNLFINYSGDAARRQ